MTSQEKSQWGQQIILFLKSDPLTEHSTFYALKINRASRCQTLIENIHLWYLGNV